MTMAPKCQNKEDYIKYFGDTKALCLDIWSKLGMEGEPVLSMGMSDSYEEAIMSGATLVRVGRTMFAKPSEVV